MGGDAGLVAEHVYYREASRPSRHSVAWMVPEVDQVLMGQGLARWIDPYMDGPRATRLRALTITIHEEMSRDPALAGLGSMLGAAYEAGFFKGDPTSGHYLALAPRKVPAPKRLPLVVFLHGSAGNFASYWQVLAPLARQRQAVVICPTFGFGNWARRRGGVDHILASIKHARRRLAGVALLVIHGHLDLRIPHAAIRGAVGALKKGGARVSRMDFANEDHFLFFAKQKQVVARLGRWIAGR